MATLNDRFCSHCFKKTNHTKMIQNYLTRNVYVCDNCHNFTLTCRSLSCDHMAQGSLSPENKKIIQQQLIEDGSDSNAIEDFFKQYASWDDEFCAEHDGTIGSFERLSIQLEEISDYNEIIKRDSINLVRAVKVAVTGLAVGSITFATAGAASPAIASALGSTGLLGAASTGTLISTLNGAALTSASLAAIGGSVAGGSLIISACGVALGGTLGGAVTNKYICDDKSFKITKLHDSMINNNAVFINGFLQENDDQFRDWIKQQNIIDKNCTMFGVNWSSSSNKNLGELFSTPINGYGLASMIAKAGAIGGKQAAKRITGVASWLSIGYAAAANDWHVSMHKACTTGVTLADIISRTQNKYYDFSGHSLGARVIYYMLESLNTNSHRLNIDNIRIGNIFLLGGAVGNDTESWEKLTNLIDGKIYNFHSDNDGILKWMYQAANIGISNPIGYDPIQTKSSKIININCSDIVNSHFGWKENYSIIRNRIL